MYRHIRDLREDRDLKQRELAEVLSCSQRVYSNYERGDIDIPTQVLIELAKIYDVSIDYLLKDSIESLPEESWTTGLKDPTLMPSESY